MPDVHRLLAAGVFFQPVIEQCLEQRSAGLIPAHHAVIRADVGVELRAVEPDALPAAGLHALLEEARRQGVIGGGQSLARVVQPHQVQPAFAKAHDLVR